MLKLMIVMCIYVEYIKIHQNLSSSMIPSGKKVKRVRGYAQTYDCYVHICGIFATVTLLRGTHWVP